MRLRVGTVASAAILLAASSIAGSYWYVAVRTESMHLSFKEPVPPPPRPSLKFTVDGQGYATKSRVWHRLDAASQHALLVVANAEVFASRAVGFSGLLSEAVISVDHLLAHPLAQPVFVELASRASPAGRLYGMCGLKALHSPWLTGVQARLTAESAVVSTLIDCIGSEDAVGHIAQNSENYCRSIIREVPPNPSFKRTRQKRRAA